MNKTESFQFAFDDAARPELSESNDDAVYTGLDFGEYDPVDTSFENCRFVSCRFNGLSLFNDIP